MKNKIEKIWEWLFLIYSLILPFGTALGNIVFGIIVAFWLFSLVRGELHYTKKDLFYCLLFSSYYIVGTLSFLYSENQDYALKKIFLQSFLLLTPVVLIGIKRIITREYFAKLISGYTISLTVLCVLSLLNQGYKFFNGVGGVYEYFFENNLSASIVDYYFLGLSLSISFSIIINLYLYLFRSKWLNEKYKFFTVPLIVFLFIFLILLNSRSLIFLTVAVACLLIFNNQLKTKNYRGISLTILSVLLIFVINFQFNKTFNEKILEAINYNNEYNIEKYWGGRGMRYLIWDCVAKVYNENKLIGVGIGDQQDKLTLCYKIYMKNQLLHNNSVFNAHNIFFQILISTGLVGFLTFIISLLYPIIKTYRNNLLYTLFIAIFIFSGLFESYLERNLCITFFSFFNVLCFLTPHNNENLTST